MCTGGSKKNDITLSTRAKDYSSSKEKVDVIPPSLLQPSPTTHTYQQSSSSRTTKSKYNPSPSSKGCHSKIRFQSSCTCCPELQNCRRSGPNTVHDVSPQSTLEFSYKTEGTVERYWWNQPYGYKFNNFYLEDHIPRLPPQLAFQIQVIVSDKNICRTIIDEGPRCVSCILPTGKPLAVLL
jgi:hypothetical protein